MASSILRNLIRFSSSSTATTTTIRSFCLVSPQISNHTAKWMQVPYPIPIHIHFPNIVFMSLRMNQLMLWYHEQKNSQCLINHDLESNYADHLYLFVTYYLLVIRCIIYLIYRIGFSSLPNWNIYLFIFCIFVIPSLRDVYANRGEIQMLWWWDYFRH